MTEIHDKDWAWHRAIELVGELTGDSVKDAARLARALREVQEEALDGVTNYCNVKRNSVIPIKG